MTPYYEADGIVIYHADNREVVVSADVVITDPPYGMKYNTDSSRFSGGENGHISKHGNSGRFKHIGMIAGDDKPFDPTPWMDYREVIMFGANHYAARLPIGSTLVWIKRFDAAFGSFLSDAEIAWEKGGHGVYCYRDLSMTSIGIEIEEKYCEIAAKRLSQRELFGVAS